MQAPVLPRESALMGFSGTTAVSWRTLVCYRFGPDAQEEGRQRLTSIQNDSDLAQGLAGGAAAR